MLTLPIYDVTPFTLLDFPGQTACIIWFSGCNMRCGYCHNPQIVKGVGDKSVEDVLAFLEKRRDLLNGVVLSGGEATLYKDIIPFVTKIKCMGYAVKLDTNGTRPDIIQEMLGNSLLDYIALDYKAPFKKFNAVTGSALFHAFKETLAYLCQQKHVPFEVRTTVHTDLIDENDINTILQDLSIIEYRGEFYIQNYVNNGGSTLGNLSPPIHRLNTEVITPTYGMRVHFRNF